MLQGFDELQVPHQVEKLGEFGWGGGYMFEQFRLKLAQANYDEFMDTIQLRVRDRIIEGNCSDDAASGGLRKGYDGQWFVFGYHRGSTVGSVRVMLTRCSNDEVLLSIVVYEGSGPRNSK